MCLKCPCPAGLRSPGFALPTAIFLLVVLAALGVLLVRLAGLAASTTNMDVLAARAYQAARAGLEWGAYQSLRGPGCSNGALVLAGTLADFTVTVTCVATAVSESGAAYSIDQITALACNAAACPAAAPGANYVERQLTVTVSR